MENNTAKHFVLQLGSLISLYTALIAFLVLTFGFINLLLPDAISSVWELESAASSIRIGFAIVLVFLPTYLVLTRLVNKNRRVSQDNSYLSLTKWLIYLSLLAGGLVLLGDLVAVIMNFLEGEITARFILKAAAVFVVTGAAFYYYILDARGYWLENEKKSIIYGSVTVIFIAAILVGALWQIPNPSTVREQKIDNTMVNDLQNIHWQIEDYYVANNALPEDLQTLFGEFPVPTAPEDKPDYVYEVTGENSYNLCATFNHSSAGPDGKYNYSPTVIRPTYPGSYNNNNWDYQPGYWCFERTINNSINNQTKNFPD